MGKFSGILICSDCDGTLTDNEKRVSKENGEAIKYFQENGGLFTVASGRFPHYALNYKNRFTPNTYVIACNGSVLYDLKADKAVFVSSMGVRAKLFLSDLMAERKEILEICATGSSRPVFRFARNNVEISDFYTRQQIFLPTVNTREEVEYIFRKYKEPVARYIIISKEEDVKGNIDYCEKHLGKKYGLKFAQSFPLGFEAQNIESGKGEMIDKIRELIPEIHTAVTVGDNFNDLSLFEHSDISYAVANAPDAVKAQATQVTVSNENHAIAAVIKDIESSL